MRFVFALLLLLATPAYAKDVTITLTDQEQKVLYTLLDAALKQGGLANLQVVAQFIQKIQRATGDTEPKPTPTPEPPKP